MIPCWPTFFGAVAENVEIDNFWQSMKEAIQPYENRNYKVDFRDGNVFEMLQGSNFRGNECIVEVGFVARNVDATVNLLKKIGIETSDYPRWSQNPHLEIRVKPFQHHNSWREPLILDSLLFLFDEDKNFRGVEVFREITHSGDRNPVPTPTIPDNLASAALLYLGSNLLDRGRTISNNEASQHDKNQCRSR